MIVCDDIENDEIVMNQERREKFRNWMLKALLPCRAPNGIVRIVGTILHLDSFLARITPADGEKHTAALLAAAPDDATRKLLQATFEEADYSPREAGRPEFLAFLRAEKGVGRRAA